MFPLILKRYVRRFGEKFQQNVKDSQQQQEQKKEGEISIKYNPEKDKNKDSGIGEYTDFEEIK